MALRFYGNSSRSFSIPSELTSAPPYSTTVSMVFRPEDVSSGLMLAIREDEANESVVLSVNSGVVHFEYRRDSHVNRLNVSNIREEQWYQVYASV